MESKKFLKLNCVNKLYYYDDEIRRPVCWRSLQTIVQDSGQYVVAPRPTLTPAADGAVASGRLDAATGPGRWSTSLDTGRPAVTRTWTRRHAAVPGPTREWDFCLSAVTMIVCVLSAVSVRTVPLAAARQTSDTAVDWFVTVLTSSSNTHYQV